MDRRVRFVSVCVRRTLMKSCKDENIEYDDIKLIAAAEFEISRDIAKIAIQMYPERKA